MLLSSGLELAPFEASDPRQAVLAGQAPAALTLEPTAVPDGLQRAAVLSRADARECLVTRAPATLGALSPGAALAVIDGRAELIVRAIRDDVAIEVVASAEAALAAFDAGRVDAALVGRCDLDRRDRGSEAAQTFESMAFLPPPARGLVSLLIRECDEATAERLASLDDPLSRTPLLAELAFAERLDDGIPIGALATLDGELLGLRAVIGRREDGRLWFGEAAGPTASAAALGRGLAERLLDELAR